MNDKQQLAAMGAQYRLTEEQAKLLAERMPQSGVLQILDVEPLCMAKRIEELEAQLEKLTNRLAWRNTGSPNGLRRFMTQKQYDAQTLGVQKWYEPLQYEVPDGWQLVPAKMTDAMENAIYKELSTGSLYGFKGAYSAMLAAAPSPDGAK